MSHLPGAWADIARWETGDILTWMKKTGVDVRLTESQGEWTCTAVIETMSRSGLFGSYKEFYTSVSNPDCRKAVTGAASVVYAAGMAGAEGFKP